MAQSGGIDRPADAVEVAQRLACDGAEAATIHLGSGFEVLEEGVTLIKAMLNASAICEMPLYAETHRATLFQDMWRTVEFVNHVPELLFNADFSHWYTGSEMTYGDIGAKLAFLSPVMERVRFMHGPIGDSGCMQVPIEDSSPEEKRFVQHFRSKWKRAFQGFLKAAQPGDYICFTPELLGTEFHYQRTALSELCEVKEVSDRWAQSLLLNKFAKECFSQAEEANL